MGATEPTTREVLLDRLDELGVRPSTYDLYGSRTVEGFVMDRRDDGWVVYYTERGRASEVAGHRDEASACADLLRRVTRDAHAFFDLVAGPAPQVEADAAFASWLRQRAVDIADLSPADWKYDDVPWVSGPLWRRYFVRITTIRALADPT